MCLGFLSVLFLLYFCCFTHCNPTIHGRYTRDIENYQLLVPRKLTREGQFLTFSIPHYFKYDEKKIRKKRSSDDEDSVHYGVTFNDKEHHLELLPNHVLIAPDAVVERRNRKVQDTQIDRLTDKRLCHFTGKIRGDPKSRVAISTCDGLVGYISSNGRKYFVEPLSEHVPNERGQHLHMVYERSQKYSGPHCGTTEDWKESWKNRLRESMLDEEQEPRVENKRGYNSVHRYLETLIVADKKFLEFHKDTDYELYIMTIMNMVSDYYHDASSGNQMDIVIVRIMYLEKEEEEIDLAINPDADKTLASFCNWQQTVNPKDIKNPNHHDIAVLLTRYDLCADNLKNCGLMGLAYVAAACTNDKPCAINEDSGLILGIVVAHEIGHVMGCSHDKEEESGCTPNSEDGSSHVMSPIVHMNTNIWSTCSKTFITTFFDNDLGECLNDEPDVSLFEDKNMLAGTLYDAKYQCQMEFPGSSICKAAPDKFCERLLCRTNLTTCMSNGEPPADGTKCGENKWCYNKKCVEIGERPAAVNGGWSDWGQFSKCSRTCGGGIEYSERNCDNPKPMHKGRYCMGERKKTRICNTQPCPSDAPSFRAMQCTEFDSKPFQNKLYKWKPYRKEGDPCALYCINSDNLYVKLAPRAKDGTRCKEGTKNMCIGGACRVVGCDFIIDSEAVEDDCGVCKGDGTECKIVDKVYQGPPGKGYVKVAVIFRGCRSILVEELKSSSNTIAITGPDEKTFYLNGDYTEQQDGVHVMGGVDGIYSHPEPNKEMLVIHGPLKENIVLFVTYYGNENVGYRYKYAEPSSKSTYQPTFHWEFVSWDECSANCGGGVETSEAKCIEEKAGLVSPTFCPASDRPPPRTRKCNEQPCKTKWRVGKWGKCLTCKNKSGVKMRVVECVREAARPGEDAVLVEDKLCKENKPGSKALCHSESVCVGNKRETSDLPTEMMQRVWLQTVGNVPNADLKVLNLVGGTRNINKVIRDIRKFERRRSACEAVSEKPKLNVGSIVKDAPQPEDVKLIEIPIKQSHTSVNLTDEAFENSGDTIPDTLDFQNEKVFTGPQAANILKEKQHNKEDLVESN